MESEIADAIGSQAESGGWGGVFQTLTPLFLLLGMGAMWLGSLYMNQESILYHPNTPQGYKRPEDIPHQLQMSSPAARDIPFADAWMVTEDHVRLHGWFLQAKDPTERSRVPTIIFFHGNAGCAFRMTSFRVPSCGGIAWRLPNMDRVYRRLDRRVNILMVDYRGYGKSEGTPTEDGLYLDAEAALDWLRARDDVNKQSIFVFGRSLGGAVGFQLASRRPDQLRALIVENTFTSIADMVDHMLPVLRPIKSLVVRMYYPSIDLVPQLTLPTMFISGQKDQLLPPVQMRRLYDAHGAPDGDKELYLIPDGGHNDAWEKGGEEYMRRFTQFVRRYSAELDPAMSTGSPPPEDWVVLESGSAHQRARGNDEDSGPDAE